MYGSELFDCHDVPRYSLIVAWGIIHIAS
jgi:hypothetical protein